MKRISFHEWLEKRPFRAFVVRLDNGREVPIRHPEDVVTRNGLIIVFKGGDTAAIFETVAISMIRPFRKGSAM